MVHQVARYMDAYIAWKSWSLTDYRYRSDTLSSLQQAIEQYHPELAKVLAYHLTHAEGLLASSQLMPGPTGETNELYSTGRGVGLVLLEASGQSARQACIAQLSCALLAGNSVIVCSDDRDFNQCLNTAIRTSGAQAQVLQVLAVESAEELIESGISVVGYIGSSAGAQTLNYRLSQHSGPIVAFINESDLKQLPVALDPMLCLRFITERTRTINITAVGGNATLLELGVEST